MKYLVRTTAVLVGASVVSACAILGGPGVAVITASPDSVSYRFKEGRLEDARKRADDHCRDYGRRATLLRVTPTEDNDRTAIFNCNY